MICNFSIFLLFFTFEGVDFSYPDIFAIAEYADRGRA